MLLATLIWSTAVLYRQRDLKYVGAVGAVASLIPLALIIAGHLFIGFSAYFGLSTLIDLSPGSARLGATPPNIIEAMFLLWAAATAVLLWKERMHWKNTYWLGALSGQNGATYQSSDAGRKRSLGCQTRDRLLLT